MAATQGFTPINTPRARSMATSVRGTRGSSSRKKPNRIQPKKFYYYNNAQLKTLLIKLKLYLTLLKQIRTAYRESDITNIPTQFKSTKSRKFINSDNRRLRTKYELSTRDNKHTFNFSPSSNTNYLPSAFIQAANGRTLYISKRACIKCQRGSSLYKDYITLTINGYRFFKSAYANYGSGNYYKACLFSSY